LWHTRKTADQSLKINIFHMSDSINHAFLRLKRFAEIAASRSTQLLMKETPGGYMLLQKWPAKQYP